LPPRLSFGVIGVLELFDSPTLLALCWKYQFTPKFS